MKNSEQSLGLSVAPISFSSGLVGLSLFKRLVLASLRGLRNGQLTVLDNGHRYEFGTPETGFRATIRVRKPSFYRSVALGGSLGAAEAWLDGAWTSDDPTTLFRLLLRNRRQRAAVDTSLAVLRRVIDKLQDRFRRNTLTGSRRNIAAHYDLSNEFFSLWLDRTMTYSSGVFVHEGASMEDASIEKLDRICRKLNLGPDDHVLEIGTGWGSFALHAARNYGCRVTTTTISREQKELAEQRIREAGLEDQVTLLEEDYRNLTGQYDHIVSIEMIEAVGHEFIPEYVASLDRLLKPGGSVAIQAITIDDRHYDNYRRSVDFIKRYIFPGGNLVSVSHLLETVSKRSSLRMTGLEEIGLHYAETLRRWRASFEAVLPQVQALGFDDRFVRMWRYYLTYCEAGFMEKHIGTAQLVFEKPART